MVEMDLSKKILKPEEVIALARENDREVIWDVTNGYPEAYEPIIRELRNRKFDYIVCPVGSGEAFVGLYDGLKKNKIKATLVGVGVSSSPSFADKLSTPWTPYKSRIAKILESKHRLIKLSELEVHKLFEKYKHRFRSEPSSTVVWAALEKLNIGPDKKIILVNSGQGLS